MIGPMKRKEQGIIGMVVSKMGQNDDNPDMRFYKQMKEAYTKEIFEAAKAGDYTVACHAMRKLHDLFHEYDDMGESNSGHHEY